jgi:hypothetical protein
MSEQLPSSELEASIHELARLVRAAQHLDPEAQRALADLVDELSNTLHAGTVPPEETSRLAETATHLARALHQGQEEKAVAHARHRFREAIALAETKAPVVTGVARRLLDILADLGI